MKTRLTFAALVAFLAAGCAHGPSWDIGTFPNQMSYSDQAPTTKAAAAETSPK